VIGYIMITQETTNMSAYIVYFIMTTLTLILALNYPHIGYDQVDIVHWILVPDSWGQYLLDPDTNISTCKHFNYCNVMYIGFCYCSE